VLNGKRLGGYNLDTITIKRDPTWCHFLWKNQIRAAGSKLLYQKDFSNPRHFGKIEHECRIVSGVIGFHGMN
jgi:hypothetical protein